MSQTINILGQQYFVSTVNYNDEDEFSKRSIAGYCAFYEKHIVVCDMRTHPGWENETAAAVAECQKANLRHEIVHAFLYESGLNDNSFPADGGWARNEEIVDWIALQGPKICKAWQEVGAV